MPFYQVEDNFGMDWKTFFNMVRTENSSTPWWILLDQGPFGEPGPDLEFEEFEIL